MSTLVIFVKRPPAEEEVLERNIVAVSNSCLDKVLHGGQEKFISLAVEMPHKDAENNVNEKSLLVISIHEVESKARPSANLNSLTCGVEKEYFVVV